MRRPLAPKLAQLGEHLDQLAGRFQTVSVGEHAAALLAPGATRLPEKAPL
jgi:hypothetical protein